MEKNSGEEMINEMARKGVEADLDRKREEQCMYRIAASQDLRELYEYLKTESESGLLTSDENKKFFADAEKQVGDIIDYLTVKKSPLVPSTASLFLEEIVSGHIHIPMKYGLRTKVEYLLEEAAKNEPVDIEV